MAEESHKDAFSYLGEKMLKELHAGFPYEALQFAESYIARKHKSLGRQQVSALVFHACKILIENSSSGNAGSLLVWYIEDGAGEDFYFKLEEDGSNETENFCDVDRLLSVLSNVPHEEAFPVVEKIYFPIHKLILKKSVSKSSSLWQKLDQLERNWVDTFVATKNWSNAYKAVARLGDMRKGAQILNEWSTDGYSSEKPLFFARAVLTMLSEGHQDKARELVEESKVYLTDNMDHSEGISGTDASLAVWHLAVIVTELSLMEPRPRVDKLKILAAIVELYSTVLARQDPKLLMLFDKIAQNSFGSKPVNTAAQNPMAALFQNMLSGGGAPSGSGGRAKKGSKGKSPPGLEGMDINTLMRMMEGMK